MEVSLLAYKIILYTSSFRAIVGRDAPIRITNAMVDRMNGLTFRESNLQEVEWRLRTLMNKDWFPSGVAFNVGFKFERWFEKNKKLCYMSVNDTSFRICFPDFPVKCKSDLNFEEIKEGLASCSELVLPFSYFYNETDYVSNFDGCYVKIVKC